MSQSKIYIGNLSYDTTENDLQDFFTQYGSIKEVKLISDHQSGRSKGFAFMTFSSDAEGTAALAADKVELAGRKLNVNTANDNRTGGGRPPAGGSRYNDRDR